MRQGNRGAEQLSFILNQIFSPLVSLVYAKGGFIPYFAGDAFTAIFTEESTNMDANKLVEVAYQVKSLFQHREYKFGEFTIGLRIGISYGDIEWGIVGYRQAFPTVEGPKRSFYFRGDPLDQCALCQQKAKARGIDLSLDQSIFDQLDPNQFEILELEEGFYYLPPNITVESPAPEPANIPPISEQVALDFLPSAVVEYQQEGEFRTVVTVFISFEGVKRYEEMDAFASEVLERYHSFSGYFKEIDFSDKGGVLVGFFGAPVSFENNAARALEFIFTLQTELEELQERMPLRYRAGITIGTAYTGIVGGLERCQYAAVGNRVNLAARLMTFADWGEILVDEEIQKNRNFIFHHKGDIQYKGIEGNVPTFKLIGKNYEKLTNSKSQMIGRNEEMLKLLDISQPLFDHKPAGITYIFGEAGIGKSRLALELQNALQETRKVSWLTCQADQILKKPFNPFIYFLRNYFQQAPDNPKAVNQTRFEQRFQLLLDRVHEVKHESVPFVKRELLRTRPIIAALIGLGYRDSLWDQLDARGKYQNTIAAIINIFVAESIIQSVVIELEDGHWLDDSSRELLQELVRQLKEYPILLLITSRYKDDGTKPILIEPSQIKSLQLPHLEVDLNTLSEDAVRSFAEVTLKGPISEEFYQYLLRTSNSNPFYLEQILEYFSESNLLQKQDGLWHIKEHNIKLSNSINGILTARIDRLSTLVKETVKAAAVIGREFEVPILTEVMKEQEAFSGFNGNASAVLKEQIKTAEKGQIWQALNELRYTFKHSLLHEAVYGMQLRGRLKIIHRLIAEAIERLYEGKLEETYVDLAFHYEQAGIFDKTCEYLRKAADYARSNYQNQQALDYYEKLLTKLSEAKGSVDEIKTLLKKGKVLELIGQWEDCEFAYNQALELAKRSRDALLLGQANNSLGHLLMLKGDYPKAMEYLKTAAQLFELIEDQYGIAKVYGNIGDLFFRQGKYEQAKSHFTRSISLSNQIGQSSSIAQIVANLGLTHMNQGNYDEGIKCQEQQLVISKRNNDKQGMATLYTNVGIVFFEKGDYDAALESYEKGLELSEELGNKLLTSIAIGCIGSVYERKGDYEKAMENFQRDLKICEELGNKQGIAIALGLIGELLSYMGDFYRAIEYLQKNLMLCESLGYQKGIAKAVNTLGDVFYFLEQYDRSLHFYNRAIQVTKKIGNRLVLGSSLVEKGFVLIELNDVRALRSTYEEAIAIAQELGNPDLLFDAYLLGAQILYLEGKEEEADKALDDLIPKARSKGQQAEVYYQWWKNHPEREDIRIKALENYQSLFEATPRFTFQNKIEELTKAAPSEEAQE